MTRHSLRGAIDAMCRSCIYDPGNGNGAWREQVQGCTSSNCPLYPVRPLSKAGKGDFQAEDAREAVGPAEDAEPDVGALLGGLFSGDGVAAE